MALSAMRQRDLNYAAAISRLKSPGLVRPRAYECDTKLVEALFKAPPRAHRPFDALTRIICRGRAQQ